MGYGTALARQFAARAEEAGADGRCWRELAELIEHGRSLVSGSDGGVRGGDGAGR